MRRRGVDTDVINRLREAYKTVYRRGLTLDQAITELDQDSVGCDEVSAFLESLKSSHEESYADADLCGGREVSGDQILAPILSRVSESTPAIFTGIAGPQMIKAGHIRSFRWIIYL